MHLVYRCCGTTFLPNDPDPNVLNFARSRIRIQRGEKRGKLVKRVENRQKEG